MTALRAARFHGRNTFKSFAAFTLSLAAATTAYAYPAWQPDTYYAAGTYVTYNGADYVALVNQTDYTGTGWTPTLASLWTPAGTNGGGSSGGGSGGGGGTTTPPPSDPPPSNPPSSPPPTGFLFGPYKDITISMNWNTNVISSAVTGSLQPVLNVMPTNLKTLTWGFATGECGTENWAGLPGASVAAANVQNFVSMGKFYIVSTGGAAGSFTCGSDAGFDTFIKRYNSTSLLGVDFDIEAGQSQAAIASLIERVKAAQRNYPKLRFSFTIATLGGNSPQSLGPTGITVMNALKASGLTGYVVNLMTMDYGSTSPTNCVVVGGKCDMAQSAIAAAENLHSFYGVPYNQIEVTPMVGGNDTIDETFTIANVDTLAAYARQKGLAGMHFWSFDRDTDCAPGYASPICNSYGTAGRLGFTTRFLSTLGL